MRFLWSLIPLICVVGTTSFADRWYPSARVTQSAEIDLQPLRCPTVGKDHSQMISELHALQDKISKDANCGKLAENLKNIGHLAGEKRDKFMEVIGKMNRGETVNDRIINEQVIKYAEDVTIAAGSLATLLTQSNQCFGKQDLSTSLFTLSTFVNEASTLLSTVAGPWGPALAVGGKVVAGFLSGVNKFIASLPGYDFNDKKDWQGYVETLCTFHEQQDEIYALIHPESAIKNLNDLSKDLETQLNKVLSGLSNGDEIITVFNAHDNDGLEREANEANIASNSNDGVKVVRLLTAQGWIQDRIEAIRTEANDPLAPGQYLVQKQRDEIEDFLVTRQGPKFIDFQVREARVALGNLLELVTYQGIELYHRIQNLNPNQERQPIFLHPQPEEILKTLVETNEAQFYGKGLVENELYSSLVYFKRELGKRWDATNLSYGVKESFCTFFERAGHYSSSMRQACTSRSSHRVEKDLAFYGSIGLERLPLPYLRKVENAKGQNWTEALNIWLNQMN